MSALLELAERCEKATGPDRELDAAIFNAASEKSERWNRRAIRLPLSKFRSRFDDGWVSVYAGKGENDPYAEDLERFTASLDAAMTLVPKWQDALVRAFPSGKGGAHVYPAMRATLPMLSAATPALALCAAALRARAAA